MFPHEEAVSCSSSREFETAQMPPICYISGKLIYCIRAWRIASDNVTLLAFARLVAE